MSYQHISVQGFLKKFVKSIKLFQKSLYYKRYFVLDHTARKMRVHQTNDPHSEYKLFEYKDILGIQVKKETLEDKMAIHERWSFEFQLNTAKRMFTLYAPSQDERNLWIHTFTWIIKRNEYLRLLQDNPSALDPK